MAVRSCQSRHSPTPPACDVSVAPGASGAAELPDLPIGRPADLSLLGDAELAAVAEADSRATSIRTREVVLHTTRPGVEVQVVQTKQGFPFGFPIDLRRFENDDDLAFYERIMGDHFQVAVLENQAKWAKVEPEPGVRIYEYVDADVEWSEEQRFTVKGHTLLWGIVPPFSSSGVPTWLLERFGAAPTDLTEAEQEEVRSALRTHVIDMVTRYRGQIAIWDVTNETLQPVAQWFVQALGPEVVNDIFRWAHEADPDATLVFNEWIIEVFTGLFVTPTAAEVRDRVVELLDEGVPIHALGQQAHFVPALVFAGLPGDLSARTHIDDYLVALDTLAEAGLPIHITETNFIAPEEPEMRAAQAEALMRLWWGHPAVEQIVFWGPWNKVAGKDEFDVGIWDDERNLSRHGEAVLSLLNDRWRTDTDVVTDPHRKATLRVTHGDYIAQWTHHGRTFHARFSVEPGEEAQHVVLFTPSKHRSTDRRNKRASGSPSASKLLPPRRTDGVERPLARHALQLMDAALTKLISGADQDVPQRT